MTVSRRLCAGFCLDRAAASVLEFYTVSCTVRAPVAKSVPDDGRLLPASALKLRGVRGGA